jgi:hypothetical protein
VVDGFLQIGGTVDHHCNKYHIPNPDLDTAEYVVKIPVISLSIYVF